MSIKKLNIKNIFIALFCFIILYSCKKDTLDYRNKFLGNYSFVIHEHTAYGISPVIVHDTTYTNDGNIENGSDKNSVLISSPSFSLQATIYEDGTLEGYWNNNGKGEFSSTNEMEYSWGNYSPGGSSTYNITGNKK